MTALNPILRAALLLLTLFWCSRSVVEAADQPRMASPSSYFLSRPPTPEQILQAPSGVQDVIVAQVIVRSLVPLGRETASHGGTVKILQVLQGDISKKLDQIQVGGPNEIEEVMIVRFGHQNSGLFSYPTTSQQRAKSYYVAAPSGGGHTAELLAFPESVASYEAWKNEIRSQWDQ